MLFTFGAFKPMSLTETNGFDEDILFFFSYSGVLHAQCFVVTGNVFQMAGAFIFPSFA
jgi:hypothetical protein